MTDALGHSISYQYDELGQLTGITDAKGVRVYTAGYDASGNQTTTTDAMNNTVTNQYDDLNRLVKSTDANQNSTQYQYDNMNRLSQVIDPNNGTSVQTFDNMGQLLTVLDPGQNQTTYAYNKVGQLLSETNMTGSKQTYSYDNRGQLQTQTNARNQQTTFQYDDAGRLTSFTDPVGAVQYGYDENGNVLTITENGKTLTRTYDALNRVTSYTDGDGNKIQYEYDAVGNLSQLIYPDGKKVTYTYNEVNELTAVTDWATRTTTYTYDENGNLLTTHRPDGSVETRTYDANDHLASVIDTATDGTVLSHEDYTYDSAGQLTSVAETATDGTVSSHEDYTYDSAGQLASVVDTAADGTVSSHEEYTYDPVGNVETANDSAPQTTGTGGSTGSGTLPPLSAFLNTTMTYTVDNRLASVNGVQVEYDADGNMTSGPLLGSQQSFQYDARNRLLSAGNVTYTYNSENIRTSLTANGVTTKYVVNPQALYSQVLVETDGQGNVTARYVYGLGLIGSEDASGNYSVYHYDRRGSTIALTNISGQVTDTYSYGPYGELTAHNGSSTNTFLYNGRYGVMTDLNGLYYMRARYYNPDIKRFINRDVVEGSIDQGLTLNHYAYVNGNPISNVDPFGLSPDGDTATLKQVANTLIDNIPWVGTIKGFQEAFTGTNLVTGETLSTADRWAEGIGSAMAIIPIPGVKFFGKAATKEAIQVGENVSRGGIKLNLQLFSSGGLSNVETRIWYKTQMAKIPELMEQGNTLEEQARIAFEWRNKIRTQARLKMADQDLARQLFEGRANLTWDQVVAKAEAKGLTGDEIWQYIIDAAQRSNPQVDQMLLGK